MTALPVDPLVAGQAALLPPLPPIRGSAWRTQLTRAFRSGTGALAGHRWRSAMTMVSVLIGVAAVLVIDSVGRSQRAALASQLATLGTNLVSVQPGAATVRGVSAGAASKRSLLDRDVAAIRDQVPHVATLTPQDSGVARITAGRLVGTTTVLAVYPEYRTIQSLGVERGTFFAERDEQARARVAVVGRTVVDHVFPGTDPIGQRLRIRDVDFTVIGVLTPRGRNAQAELDDVALVPFGTGRQALFGPDALSGILVQADDRENLPLVMAGLKRALERSHDLAPGRPDDFQLTNYQQVIDLAEQQSATLTRVLTYVAAVALTLGGMGIMNITILSVTERTREVGVMVAVGAQRRDVLLQFLAEALTLSLGGGVGGLVVGFAVGAAATRLVAALAAYPALPSLGAAALGLGVSVGIGVFFGLYPAAQAARLDPIVALRAE